MPKQFISFFIGLFAFLAITIHPISAIAQQQACSAIEYRQFDFWIGVWEVRNSDDKLMGRNKIKPILGGCALSESWQSESGNVGKSYNFYDKLTKRWHQTWIDQTGTPLYLDGEFKEGKMVLSGTRPSNSGTDVTHRITWTPLDDGRVKQHWEFSNDEGKSWQDIFVGFYNRP